MLRYSNAENSSRENTGISNLNCCLFVLLHNSLVKQLQFFNRATELVSDSWCRLSAMGANKQSIRNRLAFMQLRLMN